jgi:hypothetical protein
MKLSLRTMIYHRREEWYIELHIFRARRDCPDNLPPAITQELWQFIGNHEVLQDCVKSQTYVLHEASPRIGLNSQLQRFANADPSTTLALGDVPLNVSLNNFNTHECHKFSEMSALVAHVESAAILGATI